MTIANCRAVDRKNPTLYLMQSLLWSNGYEGKTHIDRVNNSVWVNGDELKSPAETWEWILEQENGNKI